jgi:hypothetical protein
MPTLRIPISGPRNERSVDFNAKDTFRINVLDELYEGKVYTVKRPGLSLSHSFGAGNGQGMTYYNGHFYVVIDDNLMTETSVGTTTSSGTNWTNAGNAPWAVRSVSGVVVLNNTMFMLGGVNNNLGVSYNDVWSTQDGINWSQVASSSPWGVRNGFSSAVLNGRMYVIGGTNSATGTKYNDVWSSADGATWTNDVTLAASTFSARSEMGTIAANNGIYIFGGRDSTNTSLADIWFTSNGSSWQQVQINGVSWSARSHMSVFYYQNTFFLAGGLASGVAKNDVWSSPNGATWTQLTASAFASARYIMGYNVYNNKMYVIGGFDNAGSALSDVYSSTDGVTWTLVTSSGQFGPKGFAYTVVYRTPASVNSSRYATLWFLGGISTGPATYYNSVYYANLDQAAGTSFSISPSVAGQPFQFNSFVEGTVLLVKNQSGLWVWNGGTLIRVTDPNYPTTTVPGIVVMGGFAYVMDPTGLIYNCALDDPFTWPPLNTIGADYEDDAGVAIIKYQNQIVAFGAYTTQFFYDAGNPTGSPLSPYLQSSLMLGCASANTLTQVGDNICWVSQTKQLGRQVMVMNGLQPVAISTSFIDKQVSAADLMDINAIHMFVEGHSCYLLTIRDSIGTSKTYVYDFSTKQWFFWQRTSVSYFKFAGYASSLLPKGYYMLGATDGNLYQVSTSYLDDNGTPFQVQIQTDKFDAGNNRKKFWGQLEVIGDMNSGTPIIEFNDVDYTSGEWSNPRTVDLSTQRPVLYRNGASRRRAIRYTQQDSNPLRLEAFEITFEQGM